MTARAFLDGLFRTAIAAAHPSSCLPPHLPPPPPKSGRLIVLAAGKAAGSMTEVAEAFYSGNADCAEPIAGIAVARQGYGRPTKIIPMIEAGHPIPDAAGAAKPPSGRSSWPMARTGRSRAGAAVGRRIGELDRAGRRIDARRQAGGDAGAAALGRQHRRDQHGAKTSLAHQGWPAGAASTAGSRRNAGDLRRARRRSRRDRLGADGARSDDACGRSRHRRALSARFARRRDASIGRSEQRKPEAQRPGFRRNRIQADRAAGGRLPRRRARSADARLRAGHARRPDRGRSPRRRRRACGARAGAAKARPPRGHPVRRRADGHHPRPGPGRTEPGIRPGAGHGARRRARGSRRWPATPTAPTAARAPRTTRPAP